MSASSPERLLSRKVLFTFAAIALAGVLFYLLRGILAPVLLAFLMAYAFNPLVEFLAKHRFPKSAAAGLCLLLLLLAGFSLLALIIPALQGEVSNVAKKMPTYLDFLERSAIPWIEKTFGVDLPANVSQALESAKHELGGRVDELAVPVVNILKGMLSSTLALLATLVYVILVPLFTFYFLKDYQRIVQWVANLVPPRRLQDTKSIFREIDKVLAGFLRGQLIVCSTLAVVYSVLLSIIGVPAAITIGVLAGLLNMVPYLGTVTGVLLSCTFLLLEGAPGTSFLLVITLFIAVATADGMFLTPRVLGKRLGLAPVVVILAVLAFGEIFGFLGVLLAVPVTAIGKVLGHRAIEVYRRSHAYTHEDPADIGPPPNSPG